MNYIFQLHDDASLTVKKCTLGYFKEYAIRMETQKYLNGTESESGSIELLKNVLENVNEISLQECTFQDNMKADIIFKSRASISFTSKQDCNATISS